MLKSEVLMKAMRKIDKEEIDEGVAEIKLVQGLTGKVQESEFNHLEGNCHSTEYPVKFYNYFPVDLGK